MSLLIHAGIANSRPKIPPSEYSFAVLQVAFESLDGGGLFIDDSVNGLVPTIQTATQSNTQVKYGSFSSDHNDTGIQYGISLNLAGDFTIEFDLYPTEFASDAGAGGANRSPLSLSTGSFNSSNWAFLFNADGTLMFWTGSASITTSPLTLNQWQHLALYRQSGVVRMALDGVVDAQQPVINNTMGTNGQFRFSGSTNINTGRYRGFLDNIRILDGLSAYGASNFTPPTGPHPTS